MVCSLGGCRESLGTEAAGNSKSRRALARPQRSEVSQATFLKVANRGFSIQWSIMRLYNRSQEARRPPRWLRLLLMTLLVACVCVAYYITFGKIAERMQSEASPAQVVH